MLNWEEIKHDRGFYLNRTKIFGGWLVSTVADVNSVLPCGDGIRNAQGYEFRVSIAFVPDPNHEWKLNQ